MKIQDAVEKKTRPIKIVQFGEGNFLRAFVDYMVDISNEKGLFEGDIVIVKPRNTGTTEKFKEQNCLYNVLLRGVVDNNIYEETRLITSISKIVSPYENYEDYIDLAKIETLKFIVSNTTEAGIVFDEKDLYENDLNGTYPAKLTKFLYERYKYFNFTNDKGLIILPTELIDNNGDELKKCVVKYISLWNLDKNFKLWIDNNCIFTNTLVDRIVTGYPYDNDKEIFNELGYEDKLLVTAEPFALWVIESNKDISSLLPLDKALNDKNKMDVIFTNNHKPFKQRKVRILNGVHTSMALASYLCGYDYVINAINDKNINKFIMKLIYDEIIPTLDFSKEELVEFAKSVIDRFNNPYNKHSLLSISLNSVSKWQARCMPTYLEYIRLNGKLPKHLIFSLAALLAFYTGDEIKDGSLIGKRDLEDYEIKDDLKILNFFKENSKKEIRNYVQYFLKSNLMDFDLNNVKDLEEKLVLYLDTIRKYGMNKALEMLVNV